MERFFNDCKTIHRFRSGPLGAYIQQLADELAEQGFARLSIRRQICVADQFGNLLRRSGIPISAVNLSHVSRYITRRSQIKQGDARTLKRIIEILAKSGIVPGPERKLPKTSLESVVDRYVEYLHRENALAPRTIDYHRSLATRFLSHRFGDSRVNLSSVQARDLFGFVKHEASRMSPQSAKKVTTVLRSFLRYARLCGAIDRDLTGAVPTVASYSLAGLPKGLSRDEVNRVLAGCDKRAMMGRRDYAILLLLARLGLRAGELAALDLDDIDWVAGTLSVRGKGGKLCKIPLPQDVGRAIAAYLRRDRPSVSTRRVFLRLTAPIVGFKDHRGVSCIVKRALARAGVQSRSKGAHQFRHTLATEMLRSGASLAEIGEVLRHENPYATTPIYAKVDFGALRPLAQPWVGGAK